MLKLLCLKGSIKSIFYNETNNHLEPTGIEDSDVAEFYNAIDRSNLTKKLSADRPYVYWTMEIYDQSNGMKGGGGLGVLAADTCRIARQLDIPFVLVTPFYRQQIHQEISGLSQIETKKNVLPNEFGFQYVDDVTIKTLGQPDSCLSIFQKQIGSAKFLTISEANFGELYAGDGSGDHRLYQEVSLGFGGYKALKRVGIKPAIIQLNETATVFAALARLDELCSNGMNLYEAIVYVRKHTLYTNHTLVQAAESQFSRDQFSKFVFPNIKSQALKHWLSEQFDGERLKLSSITIEISETKNCVSRLHAKVADYHDVNGEKIKFKAITNGIDMSTWVLPEILDYYKSRNIIDKFNLPKDNYMIAVSQITAENIRQLKRIGRGKLNQILLSRKDQYGNHVQIPNEAILFDFKRRFASYKRPWMPFDKLENLKSILMNENCHYIFTGKVHPGDSAMHERLQYLLKIIDGDTFLKERVHYLQDYDEELGLALSVGADIAINVPVVGLEACGTSWEKDLANLKVLISTADGGVADVDPIACLEVTGSNYEAEVASLYDQMTIAARTIRDSRRLEMVIRHQLAAYLPTISGTRMMKDYLRFLFDKE